MKINRTRLHYRLTYQLRRRYKCTWAQKPVLNLTPDCQIIFHTSEANTSKHTQQSMISEGIVIIL